MGKNHQHKKKLKSEKAKVKLKQTKTKFLPKGLNVTNTSFKIKPIVLPEQLKLKGADDVLSKRKLNISDLLSRLKHYNENVKHSACEELSEIINLSKEEVIQQHLAQICLAVSGLMQEKERKVRKGAVKVINAILQHVSNEKLQPFLGYFSTNLRCAMTNIDRNIQEDSLTFLDCFLKHNCDLIKQNSEKILPDFFTLISKLRSDSNLERTVTVNLGSKMTSVTWRIKVLSRLHAVLSMVLFDSLNNQDDKRHILDSVTFDAGVENIFPVYKDNFQRNLEFHVFNKFSNTQNSNDSNRNTEALNKHIVSLVPLLYETWLEVVPDKKVAKSSNTENTVLSDEAATVLTCIVNTLYLLWQYVKQFGNDSLSVKSVFLSSEGKKFLNHLISNFPYCQNTGRKQNKQGPAGQLKILDVNEDQKCTRENLLISLIFSCLSVNYLQQNTKNELSSIMSYITKTLFSKSYMDGKNLRYLVEFLTECFGPNSHKWRKSGVDLTVLLENTILFYNHGKIDQENKMKIFNILSDSTDTEYRTEKYTEWLANLPDVLCQPRITDIQVNSLLQLCKKNCIVFQDALLKALPNILANLKTVQIIATGTGLGADAESVKRHIINMFYYQPKLAEREKHIIFDFINQNPESTCSYYLQEILQLRYDYRNEDICEE